MTSESMHYLVEIEQQPIELYKLLKIANLVAGGGEAKIVISEGYVLLNDQVETQKRKKIYSGDIISFNGDLVEVLCHNPITIANNSDTKPRKQQKQSQHKPTTKATSNKQARKKQGSSKQEANPVAQGKRRPINF